MIERSLKPVTKRMPVLFVGHGSPMNAIEDNTWSRGFRSLGSLLPRPSAILSISAHWYVPGTFIMSNVKPGTIHDFSGFPRALYDIQYPAPGDISLAKRIFNLIGNEKASLNSEWGIDHGSWTVLRYIYPLADCPVIQLSLNENLQPKNHLDLGRLLKPLRDEGILIMGSGNITHSLRHAFMSHHSGDFSTPSWAKAFDNDIAQAIEQHDSDFLVKILASENGRMSHPTPDHYLPLLYSMGASDQNDKITFPIEGFDLSSLSMRAVLWG